MKTKLFICLQHKYPHACHVPFSLWNPIHVQIFIWFIRTTIAAENPACKGILIYALSVKFWPNFCFMWHISTIMSGNLWIFCCKCQFKKCIHFIDWLITVLTSNIKGCLNHFWHLEIWKNLQFLLNWSALHINSLRTWNFNILIQLFNNCLDSKYLITNVALLRTFFQFVRLSYTQKRFRWKSTCMVNQQTDRKLRSIR